MKIVDEGNSKSFKINGNEKIVINYNEFGEIEIYESSDPSHTGHCFSSIYDFYFYINGLSEIAKKIKEEITDGENKEHS